MSPAQAAPLPTIRVIDGQSFPIERPESVTDVAKSVRDAVTRGDAIYPVGGGTRLDMGLPPARSGVAVDLTALCQVIDYPSRDMTITVQAGIRIAELQAILRGEGQRLPIDVPRSDDATLGGAIATNTSGPRRFGYGTFRDYVIGISVIDAEGNETKAGGRVVKNVAGYDLCKLYTGSFGTLGIISQVTLKLRPLADTTAIVSMGFSELGQAAAAVHSLLNSRTRPVTIDLVNRPAVEQLAADLSELKSTGPTAWSLMIAFEESGEAVAWQEEQLAREIGSMTCEKRTWHVDSAVALWRCLVEFQMGVANGVTFKANIRSSGLEQLLEAAERQPVPWSIQAHAANGIVFGHTPLGNPKDIHRSLDSLRSIARSLAGNLVLMRVPVEWKTQLPVWGSPRSDEWLMRAIKQKLDPRDVFNPGRFVSNRLIG